MVYILARKASHNFNNKAPANYLMPLDIKRQDMYLPYRDGFAGALQQEMRQNSTYLSWYLKFKKIIENQHQIDITSDEISMFNAQSQGKINSNFFGQLNKLANLINHVYLKATFN